MSEKKFSVSTRKSLLKGMSLLTAAISGAVMLTSCDLYGNSKDKHSSSSPDEELHINDESFDPSGSYGENELVSAFLNCLRNYDNYIKLNTDVELEDVSRAFFRVKKDYPELFWMGSYNVTTGTGTTEIKLANINGVESAELPKMTLDLSIAADNIINQLPIGLDDYGKVLFVHDYIVSTTDYDWAGATSGTNGLYGTAYGCLVQGNAICQGYAEAFQIIMQKLGIDCGVVSGDSARGSHAWNYVLVNGSYYWIDTTWDDPASSDGEGKLYHTYFLMDDELLRRTRQCGAGQQYPVCSTLRDNYFHRNGLYLPGYNKESVREIIGRSLSERRAEIMFATKSALDESVNCLFGQQEIWDFSEYIDRNSTISYSMNEDMYTLTIIF